MICKRIEMSILREGASHLLTKEVVEKLQLIGIKTVIDFVRSDTEEISQNSALPFKDVLAIRRLLLAQYSAFPISGSEFYQNAVDSSSILTMPSERLNSLLDGGLYTSEVTEIAGEIAAGKTQFCLSCCVTVAMETKQHVLFLDTCGGFSADRLAEITESKYGEEHVEPVLSCIKVVEAFDIFSLISSLQEIKEKVMSKEDIFYGNVQLIIVDSIAPVIYPILGGQQMEGHGLMLELSTKIKHLAADLSVAVLIVNNVLSGEGERKVSLGKSWSHVPHNRLIMMKSKDKTTRELCLIKSSRMETNRKILVKITEKGIEDS